MHGNTRWIGFGALLLTGCFGGRKLTDTDPNPLDPSNANTDGEPGLETDELCPATDFAADCGDDAEPALVATSPSPGRIDVEHRGLQLGCGTWSAEAHVFEQEITIDYLSAEDTTSDCACAWNFTYWLPLERSGVFTIEAAGDTVVVTVQ